MKPFSIQPDVSNYRMASPGCGTEEWMKVGANLLAFSLAAQAWRPPMFFWQPNDSPIGDFFSTGDPALLGVNHSVRRSKQVWQLLEAAGEFLPIQIEGFGEASLLHVMQSGQAVDLERSQTQKLSNGNVVVVRPVLRASAIVNPGILRLEGLSARLVLIEADEGGCFRKDYARHRLTGLHLELLDSI